MRWLALAGALVACTGAPAISRDAATQPRGDAASSATSPVAAGRLVLVDLRGPLAEVPPPLALDETPTLRQVLDSLQGATRDGRVKVVVARIAGLEIGMAVAEELRAALKGAAAAGKRVVCHLAGGSNAELVVASGCQRTTLDPAGELTAAGAHLEPLFLKPLLDRLGVSADFEHVGRWKGAAEPLTREAPSAELAATYRTLTSNADRVLIESISSARRLSPAQVSAAIDRAPLSPSQALAAGLIDGVGYLDQLLSEEGKGLEMVEALPSGRRQELGSILDLLSPKGRQHPTEPHLAIIPIVGPIVDGEDSRPWSESAVAGELLRALAEVRRNDTVKAVVLRIDSPGGSAHASDVIWRAVMRVRERKPVLASLGGTAASGGYYIASAAQRILASATTLTGSIGVVGGKLVLGEAMGKLGVRTARFGDRAHAQVFSPTTRFSASERAALRAMMEETYRLFIDRVAEGRKLPRDQVAKLAEGRIWVGSEAVDNHLVDELGGLQPALAAARLAAGLPPDAPVEVYPSPRGLLDLLARTGGGVSLDALHAALLGTEARRLAAALPSLARESVWALWPVVLIGR